LAEQGAEVLDVGGESSRPRATQVSEEEELRRVIPVVRALSARVKSLISVDTTKVSVAAAALEAGATIINDVGASRSDEEMLRLAGESGAAYVCMHMQGTPATMQDNPSYDDVVGAVESFFEQRIDHMVSCGVSREQIILDPGIGFGKTLEHNLQLLGALQRFREIGRPLLLGVSRKSFIAKLLGAGVETRLPGSLACAVLAVQAGVAIIRAHDVPETVQAVRMAEAILKRRSS